MPMLQRKLFFAALLYLTFLLLFFPDLSMTAAKGAIDLCINCAIPSLFPFLLVSNLFIRLGFANTLGRLFSPLLRPLFGIDKGGAFALLSGLICGYPTGASCTAALYQSGNLSKEEAERLLIFCNNAGPTFVLGAVGVGMLHSKEAGAMLYGIHLFSALLTGLLLRPKKVLSDPRALPPAQEEANPFAALGEAVFYGVSTMSKICGFILFFSVFTAPLHQTAYGVFVYPFLEITGGLAALSPHIPPALCLPLVSFFLAFSGACILMQIASIITPLNLSFKPVLKGKLLHGILSFFITLPVQAIYPLSLPVSSFSPPKAFSALTFFSFAGKGFLLWCIPLVFALLWSILGKNSRSFYK